MNDFDVLFPDTGDQSSLLVSCSRSDYSASHISRAIEDCDAQVLNLNVTSLQSDASDVVVAIRINHRNPQAAVHSLQRYGYEVLSVESSSIEENEKMRSRANELLRYLEM